MHNSVVWLFICLITLKSCINWITYRLPIWEFNNKSNKEFIFHLTIKSPLYIIVAQIYIWIWTTVVRSTCLYIYKHIYIYIYIYINLYVYIYICIHIYILKICADDLYNAAAHSIGIMAWFRKFQDLWEK